MPKLPSIVVRYLVTCKDSNKNNAKKKKKKEKRETILKKM